MAAWPTPAEAAAAVVDTLRLPGMVPLALEHEDVMDGSVVEPRPEDSSVVWLDTDEFEDRELREVFRWKGRVPRPVVAVPSDVERLP